MTKVKELKPAVKLDESNNSVGTETVSTVTIPISPEPVSKIRDEDKAVLDLARARKDTAVAQAREAIAKSETAELSYKYVILQLYMKYDLSVQDALSEQGDIVRGGALPQGQVK